MTTCTDVTRILRLSKIELVANDLVRAGRSIEYADNEVDEQLELLAQTAHSIAGRLARLAHPSNQPAPEPEPAVAPIAVPGIGVVRPLRESKHAAEALRLIDEVLG